MVQEVFRKDERGHVGHQGAVEKYYKLKNRWAETRHGVSQQKL